MRSDWPFAGLSVFFSESDEFCDLGPERKDLCKHTPQLSFHGHHGFSLGRYSELFVLAGGERKEPNRVAFTMGSMEGSVGDITPLAHLLFRRDHDDDLEGELSWFESLRLVGCTHENAERSLISAVLFLEKEHGIRCQPFPVGNAEWPDDAPGIEEPEHLTLPRAFSEVEPLRMLFRVRLESDPASAFLQAYRTLEYFSVFQLEDQVARLRVDQGLSSRAFLLEVQKLIGRDERAALGRLVARLADPALLAKARDSALIAAATSDALTNALYDFRNSVVHAKYDQRTDLFSESIFSEESAARNWKSVCEDLAWKACISVSGRLT